MNKKGFTLIELLAAVVILGVLSSIAIVSIYKILESSEKNYYSKQEDLLVLAGKDYFASHHSRLPKTIGKTEKVYLSTLIDQKYIDPVLSKNKKECDRNASYVSAKKVSASKYKYQVYLKCPGYNGKENIETSPGAFGITFIKNSDISKNKISVKMKISGTDIASYKYKVVNVKTGAVKDSANKPYNGDINIIIKDQGTYQITGTAVAKNGEVSEKTSGFYIIDKKPPTCGFVTGASVTWANTDRTISVKCQDDGSGCKQSIFSANFTTSTKMGIIQIEDEAGNVTNCNVPVYIDKIKPTCGAISGASTSWTKNDRTISLKCNDTLSGCAKDTFSTTFNTTTKTGTIFISDKANNFTSCPVNVYIDKTAPKCGTIAGASTTWTKNNRNIIVGCTDEGSGCSNNAFPRTFNSTLKTGSITVKDKVENFAICPVDVYVDKTPPAAPAIYNPSGGNWTKNSFSLSLNSSDGHSGIAYYQYSYDNKNWTTYGNSASNSFTTTPYSAERNQPVYIRVIDKAGNISPVNSTMIRIDKTPPSIQFKPVCNFYLPTNGKVNKYVVQTRAVDSGSGLHSGDYYFSNTFCAGPACNLKYNGMGVAIENFVVTKVSSGDFGITVMDMVGNQQTIRNNYPGSFHCGTAWVYY